MMTPRLTKLRTIQNWSEWIAPNDPRKAWQSDRDRAGYYGIDVCRRLISGNYVACRKLTRRKDEKFVRDVHAWLSEGGTLQRFAP